MFANEGRKSWTCCVCDVPCESLEQMSVMLNNIVCRFFATFSARSSQRQAGTMEIKENWNGKCVYFVYTFFSCLSLRKSNILLVQLKHTKEIQFCEILLKQQQRNISESRSEIFTLFAPIRIIKHSILTLENPTSRKTPPSEASVIIKTNTTPKQVGHKPRNLLHFARHFVICQEHKPQAMGKNKRKHPSPSPEDIFRWAGMMLRWWQHFWQQPRASWQGGEGVGNQVCIITFAR